MTDDFDHADDDIVRVRGASKAPKVAAVNAVLAKADSKDADYGDDAVKPAVTADQTLAITALAQELVTAQREVTVREDALKKAEKALADIQENRLPKMMQQYNMWRVDFTDESTGLKQIIKRTEDVRVSLPTRKDGNKFVADHEARKPIWAWLRDDGQGGVIKKTIEVATGRYPDERAAALMDHIKNFDKTLDPGLSEKVEPATLKALIKKMREAGKNIHEAIRVEPFQIAKVVDR